MHSEGAAPLLHAHMHSLHFPTGEIKRDNMNNLVIMGMNWQIYSKLIIKFQLYKENTMYM